MSQLTIVFENHILTSLDKYNGLSQVYCLKPEGRIHISIQRVKKKERDNIYMMLTL